jgi:hypothetical protein
VGSPLVRTVLVPEAVLTEQFAVVGGVHEDGIFEFVRGGQRVIELADVLV